MEIKTHQQIDQSISGIPTAVETDRFASVILEITDQMKADEKSLVHGGFLFSAADYCSMLAVNHPNVVLAKAEVRFLKPVRVGEHIFFEGIVVERKENRRTVEVSGKNEKNEIVFAGKFYCVIPEKHVLD
ncbi:MAG: hotdog domain-containing protein [Persephonella sp.]|nr:hotdog domain-containing protein [Persephonella sp.]